MTCPSTAGKPSSSGFNLFFLCFVLDAVLSNHPYSMKTPVELLPECRNTNQATPDPPAGFLGATSLPTWLQICFPEEWLLTPTPAGVGEEGDKNDLYNSC